MGKKVVFKEEKSKYTMQTFKPSGAAKIKGIDRPTPRKVKHV